MKYIVPSLIMIIIIIALSRRKNVYTDFIEGAQSGIELIKDIFPPLVAMLTAAAMLRASGAMDLILRFVSPFTQKVGLPSEILPLVLIRPVSGSGSIGVLSGILNEYGPDSMIGRMASVICASTETTFYCMAVYFAKTRVKTIKKAAIGAVIGDLAGICAAAFVLRVLGM